jgi:hypothetical protein
LATSEAAAKIRSAAINVAVWSITETGDVAPQGTIGKGILTQERGLTLDPVNKTVIVSDNVLQRRPDVRAAGDVRRHRINAHELGLSTPVSITEDAHVSTFFSFAAGYRAHRWRGPRRRAGMSAQGPSREGGARFQPPATRPTTGSIKYRGSIGSCFDTITADGLTNALLFINNYYTANQTGYGLTDKDLARVARPAASFDALCVQQCHLGQVRTPITQRSQYNDPSTNQPPKTNLFAGSGTSDQGGRNTRVTVAQRGVQFAVCQISTRNYANTIAMVDRSQCRCRLAELAGNRLANARLVPAGIVAVNRRRNVGTRWCPSDNHHSLRGFVMSVRRIVAAGVLGAAAWLGGATLVAHHSFTAEFDDKKSITLRGTLTKVEFTNPHGWLYLNVKDDKGVVQNWAIETGAPFS